MGDSLNGQDVQDLRRRLEEAEETLRAIRHGEVDALVVETDQGAQIYTLQGADQSYRTLIEAMHQGAVSLTSEGDILYCNRCLAEILKVPHERIIGAAVADFVPASHRNRFELLLRSGQTQSGQGEFELQTGEGTLLPVYVTVAPLPLGSTTALCMVVTDLTEQKKHQVLQEANRRKDEFLAMLAHELRNPLAPIRTGLEVMKLAKDDPETIESVRHTMERQTQQVISLVDDLLDVSRITRGKLELRKCRVKLLDVVQSAVEASQPFIAEASHQLEVSLPDEPISLDADPNRLVQILSNLLNNAAKYTPEGGRIRLTVQREGDQVAISIKDNGIGIPADMLDRIFDMFAQIDRPMERGYTGLGIGLTLVKSLVELHAGRIVVQSDGPGQGSESIVWFPILLDKSAHDGKPASPEEQPRLHTKRRVLVVDDNRAAVDMLSIVVKMLNNEVRTAGDGIQAIEVAQEFQPDVVLMDIGMPKMNGYETARHIRQQPWGQNMMLVALTGWGQDEDKQRSKDAGFDFHLIKPAEPAELQKLFASLDQEQRV